MKSRACVLEVSNLRGARRLHHTPGVTRRAHAPAFAGERDEELVPTIAAAGAGKDSCGADLRHKKYRHTWAFTS